MYASDTLTQRRLARSVLSYEAVDLARFERQTHVQESGCTLECLAYVLKFDVGGLLRALERRVAHSP